MLMVSLFQMGSGDGSHPPFYGRVHVARPNFCSGFSFRAVVFRADLKIAYSKIAFWIRSTFCLFAAPRIASLDARTGAARLAAVAAAARVRRASRPLPMPRKKKWGQGVLAPLALPKNG